MKEAEERERGGGWGRNRDKQTSDGGGGRTGRWKLAEKASGWKDGVRE